MGVLYKKGDFIGQKYKVYDVLGKGGFGIVYLVYSLNTKWVYALKTFRDEYLADEEIRKRFHKEASVWVELGRHPYLVRANFVDEVSGRLYIGMEYIIPDKQGLNSLAGYLQRKPPDLAQSLRWAIQICYGMEYAYTKGVRAHRDLKPANILISQDKTARITDFGLAGIVGESSVTPSDRTDIQPGRLGLSGQTMEGVGFGTPTHMPPEQFEHAAECDQRSDIYSFGIVLYQMASGGCLPFPPPMGADWRAMQRLHQGSPVPRLDSPLFPIIHRCLEKAPDKRYRTFSELRKNLEPLLHRQTGEVIEPPQAKELEVWEYNNKGYSFNSLGRYREAILCYDRALELYPRHLLAWSNKGVSLSSLDRREEAIRCYDQALALEPSYVDAWYNKGNCLDSLGRNEEAIACFDKALVLNPRDVKSWYNKGNILHRLGLYEEAIRCFDQALGLDPHNLASWNNKGSSLASLDRHQEAIVCFNKALEFNPRDVKTWYNKGNGLHSLGRNEEAIRCFDQALGLDPHNSASWINKGSSLNSLGHYDEAIGCYDRALHINQRDVDAWNNKGNSLLRMGRYIEAIACYDQALVLDPRLVDAWINKGNSLHNLDRYEEALSCFNKALELDPRNVTTWSNKGESLDSLGCYEESIRCHDKTLELDPRNFNAWHNKGYGLNCMGRYEEAIRCLDKALELNPRDADT